MKLFWGLLITIFVYIIGWHLLYGQFIHTSFKKYQNWLVILSIPSTYMSIYACQLTTEYFNGKVWPNRAITLSIGIIFFYLLSNFYFEEKITIKTIIILSLALTAGILQIVWK